MSVREGHEKCLKNLQKVENEHKKHRAILEQKIQFLTQELKEYQQRDHDNKKINQSIMMTYQQSEHFREEYASKSIKQLTNKYENQIKRIKESHFQQCRKLQEDLAMMRDKCDKITIELEKQKLQHEKVMLELKKKHEQFVRETIKEKQQKWQRKIQTYEDQVKQAESMADVYKQFVGKRRENIEDSYLKMRDLQDSGMKRSRGLSVRDYTNKQNRSIERSRKLVKNMEESNESSHRVLKANRESLKVLNTKINRAISQLKAPDTYHKKINERFKQKGVF